MIINRGIRCCGVCSNKKVFPAVDFLLHPPSDWLKDTEDLFIPSLPAVSLQWTYRDGRLVNLPVSLLVEGDIICLRPGSEAPTELRGIQVSRIWHSEVYFKILYPLDSIPPPVPPFTSYRKRNTSFCLEAMCLVIFPVLHPLWVKKGHNLTVCSSLSCSGSPGLQRWKWSSELLLLQTPICTTSPPSTESVLRSHTSQRRISQGSSVWSLVLVVFSIPPDLRKLSRLWLRISVFCFVTISIIKRDLDRI